MGRHDSPSAGKTPSGKKGSKPQKLQVNVQTSTGTTLWKGIASMFKGGKK
jgi:hypothetical protein